MTEESHASVATPAPGSATPSTPPAKPSRLNQAVAWVGVAAGSVFVFAAIFFSGFLFGQSTDGNGPGHPMGPASAACCDHMGPGHHMGMGSAQSR